MPEKTAEELKEELRKKEQDLTNKRLEALEKWKEDCDKSSEERIKRDVTVDLNIKLIFDEIKSINKSIVNVRDEIKVSKEDNSFSITGFIKKNLALIILAIYVALDRIASI